MRICLGAMNNAPTTTPGQPVSQSADEILTKPQTAQRLHKSKRTVDAWMKAKKLPYIKVGKTVLFRWNDILAKLDTFRVN
jgi:excisionase family DNA binding protein